MKLEDKVAIVTGAGQGIGRAYAQRFVEEGASVIVADIAFEKAQAVAKEIDATGGKALPILTDVSDEASTSRMAKMAIERFGRIDILLNNAAVFYGVAAKPWDSWNMDEWTRMYAVNVIGSWLCSKAVVPQMIAQGKGKIINVASGTADCGLYHLLPYTCSKGAVTTLTKCLAKALGGRNINVNCISPGFTIDEATLHRYKEGGDRFVQERCLQRHQYPDDLVGTAVFLASSESDFVTGQVISVDGGVVLR
jgi:3-oxoacyl-[acyl-carrier protein] reductase